MITRYGKVRYLGATDEQVRWGSCADPRGKLEVGNVYEVEYREFHTWHTKLKLVGIPGKFNSGSFEIVIDRVKSRAIQISLL